jgi:dTDP-4-amino-4,6-dideoxygalactose transaminase
MTCFSFNAVKNIAAADGGMVTSNDPELAQKVREYISLGLDTNTYHRYMVAPDDRTQSLPYRIAGRGQNLHFNDVLASLAIVQLRRLDSLNASRLERVQRYRRNLSRDLPLTFIEPRPGTRPSWHMCTVLIQNRDEFVGHMATRGISVGIHYPPIHCFDIAKPWRRSLPQTERIAQRTATLPLYPTMTDIEQDRVIEAIEEWCSTKFPKGQLADRATI